MILVQIKECILLLKFFFYELDPFNVIQKKKKSSVFICFTLCYKDQY